METASDGAPEYKFWAFISYSHADKQWGDWLHKALETYRVPSRLVGRPSRDGKVPSRLYPVFRDREELPGSSDLGRNISDALRASRYIVVICSPRSAASRWVNEEIKSFKALGREGRVLCLIVDGEPNASDKPESGLLECFPEALRFRVDGQGRLSGERTEPIAADAREGQDGKEDAKLKLLSGLIGVGYDELKQREAQRRFWRRVQLGAAAAAAAALLLGFWRMQERKRERMADRIYAESSWKRGWAAVAAQDYAAAALHFARAHRLAPEAHPRAEALALMEKFIAAKAVLPHPAPVRHVAINRDGTRLLTGAEDGKVRLFDARDRILLKEWGYLPLKEECRLEGPTIPITGLNRLEFDSGGKVILTVAGDIQLRDAATGEPLSGALADETGSGAKILDAALSPDGAGLVAAYDDHTARFWDARSGAPVARKIALPGLPYRIAFAAQGRQIAALFHCPIPGVKSTRCFPNNQLPFPCLQRWSADSGLPLDAAWGLESNLPPFVLFGPDARHFLAFGLRETVLHAVEPGALGRSGARQSLTPDAGALCASFSENGKLAATGDWDGNLRLWSLKPGSRLAQANGLRPHGGGVNGVVFASGPFTGGDIGSFMLSAAGDGYARLWAFEHPEPLGLLPHAGPALSAALNPDGLAITGGETGASLWDLSSLMRVPRPRDRGLPMQLDTDWELIRNRLRVTEGPAPGELERQVQRATRRALDASGRVVSLSDEAWKALGKH